MKQIITEGILEEENKPLVFKCHRCGCEFKSDEYEVVYSMFTYSDPMCGTIRKQVDGYKDVCPYCDTHTCMEPQEKTYVYIH